MNYRESTKIFEEIKKAKKVYVNCHKNPDPDSIGSALAMREFLLSFGKDTEIVCSTKISDEFKFIEDLNVIKTEVDFSGLSYREGDLFVVLDSSSWDFASGEIDTPQPDINMAVIDHHVTNTGFGKINLVDDKSISTCEVLYLFFEDCGFDISKKTARYLLTGILGDSGVFRFHGTTAKTLRIAADLVDCGVDQYELVKNLYFSVDFDEIKFWGEAMKEMRYEKEGNFVWVSISNETYNKYKARRYYKEDIASAIFQSVKNSNFGIVMVEDKNGSLGVSLRSRTGFDVSKIAKDLGGGGHVYAAGCTVKNLPFKEAVEKVMEVVGKYVKKSS